MARTVTRAQLRTRARQLANMENATILWPDADVNERIDTHTCSLWNMLVDAAPPDYYASSTTISVVAGTIAYALPADFMSLQDCFVQEGSTDKLRQLRPMRGGERSGYQAPQSSATVTLDYTPNFTTFSGDSSTMDGVNGWDELVVNLVARDLLRKARESTDHIDPEIMRLRAMIIDLGNRDRGHPRYIRDVEEERWPGYISGLGPTAYVLKASNIEFYENRWPV